MSVVRSRRSVPAGGARIADCSEVVIVPRWEPICLPVESFWRS